MSLGHKTKPAPRHPNPERCLQLMLTEAPLKTGGREERPSHGFRGGKAILCSPACALPLRVGQPLLPPHWRGSWVQSRPWSPSSEEPSRAQVLLGHKSHLHHCKPWGRCQQCGCEVATGSRAGAIARQDLLLPRLRGWGQSPGRGTFPSLARSRLSSILLFSTSTSSLVPLSTMTSSSWKAAPHWRGERREERGPVSMQTAATPGPGSQPCHWASCCFPTCTLAWSAVEVPPCLGKFPGMVSPTGLPTRLALAGVWECTFLEGSSHFQTVLGFCLQSPPLPLDPTSGCTDLSTGWAFRRCLLRTHQRYLLSTYCCLISWWQT